jgi:hypothetical protein
VSNYSENFAGQGAESRMYVMDMFTDEALEAMARGGYFNEFTGELMTATREEVDAVYAYRTERAANWEAEYLANEIVGDQKSYNSIIASDTEAQASYSLQVNGTKSEHGTYVNKWGIAYAVVRELQAHGIDADSNTGFIAAVLGTLDSSDTVSTSGLEFSTTFESN